MIVFVRHGQTAVNRAGALQGRFDAPLTDLGQQQAALVARALTAGDEKPVRVWSSPLLRARSTAEAIATACGDVEVEVDDRLVELDYGEWDQRPLAELSADVWQRWRTTPGFAPPGGESLEAVQERVVDFCAQRMEEWHDSLVVAVSHVSPIKAAVCWALDVDARTTWRMQLGLASITRVGAGRDGSGQLLSFNETSHLTA
jgi:probable phosphoglycerate mutase